MEIMPTTNIGQRVKNTVSLTNEEVELLNGAKISTESDLRFTVFDDLPVALPVVKRRKLNQVQQYLARGDQLSANTTIEAIQEANIAADRDPGGGMPAVQQAAPDPNRGAPKIYTNPLPDFSGDPVDFEEWERKAGSIIKQSTYKKFINSPSNNGDVIEEARSSELFNMIYSCVGDGHALNVVEKVRDDNNGKECGHQAWAALKAWYLDDTQKDTMIKHYETKLDTVLLDKDTSATNFINNFQLCIRKLVKLGENWSDEKQVREFKFRINDPDYEVESRVHEGNFAELVNKIRKREQDLERDALAQSANNKRTRRFQRKDDDDVKNSVKGPGKANANEKSSPKDTNVPYIPFIPTFLYKSMDHSSRLNLVKWRKMVNDGETMGKEDLYKGGDDNPKTNKETSSKKKQKGQGKKNRRVTKQKMVETADDTVEVTLVSSGEEYLTVLSNTPEQIVPFGHDSKFLATPDHSIVDVKKKECRIRALQRCTTSVGMSGGRKGHQPYAVIDPGAEQDLIGGVGFAILHFSNEIESLTGPLQDMGTTLLPKVDAVTAVHDCDGKTILLGVGNAAYDKRSTQHESLLNSHHLRKNGVVVEDVAKECGGNQCIKITDYCNKMRTIPLDFNGDIMMINLREPTQEELLALRVNWILPPMENITPQSLRRSRIALESFKLHVPNEQKPVPEEEILVSSPSPGPLGKGKRTVEEWKELLGFPSDKVVEKTLEATTQLQVEPVEAERREIPRQHRKKRLLMLHPRRIPGRTDADTVFATVKSIRGYRCAQFFCHVPSDFLFVRCMQRESHSHGAYEDYIREVGVSETIVTDNSQTQTSKKWATTSRKVMTKQRTFTPHNQNESKVERRIQDVKHKTTLVLQRSRAPLEFWCYALIFVTDCLNHVAKKQLDWKTSSEMLNGETPDISPFRFKFWQPIKFYDIKNFPGSRWTMGRYLGIAWDTGDHFTFKLWSEPNGDYKKGREYTRNVVRPRNDGEIYDTSLEVPDTSQFQFQKKVLDKKRKRGSEQSFILRTLPELSKSDDCGDIGDGQLDREHLSVSAIPSDGNSPIIAGGDEETEEPASGSTDNTTTIPKPISKLKTAHPSSITAEPKPISVPTSEEVPFDDNITMAREVNDELSCTDEAAGLGGSKVMKIVQHDWKFGHLHLKVLWSSGQTSWEQLKDMREDYPKITARYIVQNKVSRSKRGGDRVLQWAKKVEKDMERAIRRIAKLYDFYLNENNEIKRVRRTRKSKKKFSTAPRFKYGIEVPKSVRHALEIDKANGNTFWEDSLEKEIKSLLDLDCFEFKPFGYHEKLDNSWQKTTLHCIFDVKQDLTRKCRLVAGGHLVDVTDIQVYSSTVKSISVQLLHVISHKAGLKQLFGDIGNAFPNAFTEEKVFVVKAGPEFGKYEGQCIIIRKALYGLCSSAERFHAHLADSLRSFGFKQTRFDNDVWIRKDKSGKCYEYICTHVDGFMICSKHPEAVMKEIESVYLVKESSKGAPNYYLGNDYKRDKNGKWCIGCKTYLTEAIRRIEEFLKKKIQKRDTPMAEGDHPEKDSSEVLDDNGHRTYQMLIGMLTWICCIGRMDVTFAAASLSRFTACPRQGHLDRVLRVFGYLKKHRNRRIVIDSRDPILKGSKDALRKDFTKEFQSFYPDASEEIDPRCPEPLVDELEVTAFVDSDHAHDKVTRRSITGLLVLLGRTPVFVLSKRQGAIETSTYGAEFCAMRTAVEEVQSIRYMLRCLGVKVTFASLICGDNSAVISNCTVSASLLKKKHVAIAYHKTRESAAAGAVHPIKV